MTAMTLPLAAAHEGSPAREGSTVRPDIRNLAIIAHVDHGKTTLVDRILKICGTFRENQEVAECVMDSFDQERERGITILAKNCAVRWREVKVNILDTPGHADFGGEVERVLRMADGCLLLVDAAEGPMPQTRFVLQKAFENGLRPIVVINKIDRKDARAKEVLNEVYDLFIELGASEEQLEFPVLYGSGRAGYMMRALEDEPRDIQPLMDTILERLSGPRIETGGALQLLVSNIMHDDYVGRIAVGRIQSGSLREGDQVLLFKHGGGQILNTVKQLYGFAGLGRERVYSMDAGDIVAVVGLDDVEIGDSLTSVEDPRPLAPMAIEPPTITMLFIASDSPFRGRDGEHVTSRKLKQRLDRELKKNVALRVEDTGDPTRYKVSGRGLLHLGVLLETMRREGFEVQVSKPEVITRQGPGGLEEPIEELVVNCPPDCAGKVIEAVGGRRGEMHRMEQRSDMTRIEFRIPSRGLIGLRTRLLNATRGEAVMASRFIEYGPWRGDIPGRTSGVLVSMVDGETTSYALFTLKDRGSFFISPGDPVYEGMIIGEHCKENDIVVNTTRKKHLTNIRAAGADDKIMLPPPHLHALEEALEYIADDELCEITPRSIRLRKKLLKEKDRKRAG